MTGVSNTFRLYLTERAGKPAAIVFDEKAALDINESPQTHALRYRLPLKTPTAEGLASREEAEILAVLDESFDQTGAKAGARLIGRMTTDGMRWIYMMVTDPPQPLADILFTLARSAGYTPEVFYDPDPERTTYWKLLYPNGEEWNTITDFDVLRALIAKGDTAERVRGVDHGAYFPSRDAADRFAQWAGASQMTNVIVAPSKGQTDPDLAWHVQATHRGTMKPEEITAWSKAVYRSAIALGGRYGGWETDVV